MCHVLHKCFYWFSGRVDQTKLELCLPSAGSSAQTNGVPFLSLGLVVPCFLHGLSINYFCSRSPSVIKSEINKFRSSSFQLTGWGNGGCIYPPSYDAVHLDTHPGETQLCWDWDLQKLQALAWDRERTYCVCGGCFLCPEFRMSLLKHSWAFVNISLRSCHKQRELECFVLGWAGDHA